MNRRSFFGRAAAWAVGLVAASRTEAARPVYPIIDCRDPARRPRGLFSCFDADTEEHIRCVFYYDPNTDLVGRYLRHPKTGRFYIDAATDDVAKVWEHRPLRMTLIPGTERYWG